MTEENDKSIEKIASEEADLESSPAHFEVLTYPADFTLETLVSKFAKKQIKIPGFQRKFVWDIKQSSKLIESFLLGLPVPSIFLYNDLDDSNVLNVIDGQQRLMTIIFFFSGYFGEEKAGRRQIFNLTGLSDDSPYNGFNIDKLKTKKNAAFNQLNDSVLRAFVIKQINPKDNTSIYHIFERLNTGGTQLVGQEIRNCVYHGSFNDLLLELNKYEKWRSLFGSKKNNKRMRDVELILRFFALWENPGKYKKPMKDFLSNFMRIHQNRNKKELLELEATFRGTVDAIHHSIGEKPFHIRVGLNAAVFDSVFLAFAENLKRAIPKDIKAKYKHLVKNKEYLDLVTSSTTDEDIVRDRIKVAKKELFA